MPGSKGTWLGAWVVLALLLTLMAACGGGQSTPQAAQQSYEWRLATTSPKDAPRSKFVDRFAELVDAKTKGRVKINNFYAQALGSGEELAGMIQSGALDMAIPAAMYKDFAPKADALINLPFLVTTYEEADAAFDMKNGWIAKLANADLAKANVQTLVWFDNDFRALSNSKRAVRLPSDVKGMKIRVPAFEPLIKLFEAYGASPVPMAFAELFTALQQKVVDGQDNGPVNTYRQGFYQVQPYFTNTNHQYSGINLGINMDLWNRLPKDIQTALMEAADEAGRYGNKLQRDDNEFSLKKMEEGGVQVIRKLEPNEVAQWREKAPGVWEQMRPILGDETMALVYKQTGVAPPKK